MLEWGVGLSITSKVLEARENKKTITEMLKSLYSHTHTQKRKKDIQACSFKQ